MFHRFALKSISDHFAQIGEQFLFPVELIRATPQFPSAGRDDQIKTASVTQPVALFYWFGAFDLAVFELVEDLHF